MKKLPYFNVFTLVVATAGLPTVAQSQPVNYDANAPRIVRHSVLAFAQPIPTRTALEITLQEIEPIVPSVGNLFNYELAKKHLGLEELIPYGLARFQANTTVRP